MTISEREIGEMKQMLKNLDHQRRNDRTIINALDSELSSLRADVERLRARMAATISSIAICAGALAWLIEFISQ